MPLDKKQIKKIIENLLVVLLTAIMVVIIVPKGLDYLHQQILSRDVAAISRVLIEARKQAIKTGMLQKVVFDQEKNMYHTYRYEPKIKAWALEEDFKLSNKRVRFNEITLVGKQVVYSEKGNAYEDPPNDSAKNSTDQLIQVKRPIILYLGGQTKVLWIQPKAGIPVYLKEN